MPNIQDRNDNRFCRFDAMSTEELQAFLRKDASKPVGEESDSQALFYIMEVLAKRRKERNEGKPAAEALESFKKNYHTETDTTSDSESAAVTRKRISTGRWRRGLVAAVVAICILVAGNSITASAFGFDLFEIIAKWTQETFHFGYAGQSDNEVEPEQGDSTPYAGLQTMLNKHNIALAVPTWIPDGYVEVDANAEDTPLQRRFVAKYQLGDNTIRIRIVDYLNGAPSQVEQSDGLLEVYSSADIDYYIMDNEDQLQAVWIINNYECCIIGPLTLPEIKQIIDSIGKV